MSEPESEDEILDRIEAALRRIASARPHGQPAAGTIAATALDQETLAATLDSVIARLRGALTPPQPPETE